VRVRASSTVTAPYFSPLSRSCHFTEGRCGGRARPQTMLSHRGFNFNLKPIGFRRSYANRCRPRPTAASRLTQPCTVIMTVPIRLSLPVSPTCSLSFKFSLVIDQLRTGTGLVAGLRLAPGPAQGHPEDDQQGQHNVRANGQQQGKQSADVHAQGPAREDGHDGHNGCEPQQGCARVPVASSWLGMAQRSGADDLVDE
jgi:hypothetical protein